MFRTVLKPAPSNHLMKIGDQGLSIGSCFADTMARRLTRYKFAMSVNPFGVIFNPLSIFKLLNYALEGDYPGEETYVRRDEVYYNFDVHSQLSHPHKHDLKQHIRQRIDELAEYLSQRQWLWLTFGTSLVYERTDGGQVVANCHKIPAAQFTRRLLSVKEILVSFEQLFLKLKALNPDLKILVSVSPVRHLKDTLTLNSVSKANLRVACHHMVEQFEGVDYFPGYELMMDDLRDYRFYAEDMLHISPVAEQYIWSYFTTHYCDQELQAFIAHWHTILADLSHRPFHPQTKKHQDFLKKLLAKLIMLQDRFDVQEEIDQVESQLKNFL